MPSGGRLILCMGSLSFTRLILSDCNGRTAMENRSFELIIEGRSGQCQETNFYGNTLFDGKIPRKGTAPGEKIVRVGTNKNLLFFRGVIHLI